MHLNGLLKVLAVPIAMASAHHWGPMKNGKTCTVKALGNKTDDTTQILKAFEDCNNGGTVVFPENQNYWIGTKLNPILHDVTIDWRGIWTVGFSNWFMSVCDILIDA